jgi:hypothetical protein
VFIYNLTREVPSLESLTIMKMSSQTAYDVLLSTAVSNSVSVDNLSELHNEDIFGGMFLAKLEVLGNFYRYT